MLPRTEDVVEVRSTWTRIAASPWAGFEMRYAATLVDGQTVALDGNGTVALLEALRAAGAQLVEWKEGWSRVCRVGRGAARPATVEEALGQMVARGREQRPGLAGRLEAAAQLVRDGRVELVDGGDGVVGPYRISAEGCTCADFAHRGGWCKHRLAVRMGRHLVAHGFELPRAVEEGARPLVSAANLALIGSGQVIDRERRTWAAYRGSSEGARRWALTAMSQGQGTLPAEIARRAGVTTNYELRATNEEVSDGR